MLVPIFISQPEADLHQDPYQVFKRLSLMFEEGFFMDNWGGQGFSYFGFSPAESISAQIKSPESPQLQSLLRHYIEQAKNFDTSHKFPFEGGVVSLIGYNCGAEFEEFPLRKKHGESQEDFCLALYDQIVIYDHATKEYFLSICNLTNLRLFGKTSMQTLEEVSIQRHFSALWAQTGPLGPHEPFQALNLHMKESKNSYCEWVERAVEYISAGDIFQANLAHPLSFEFSGSPIELYGRMRAHNPSPYGAVYFKPGMTLLSNSPELLFSNTQGKIITRPIAGTRPRSEELVEDEGNRLELFLSDKEQAEHIMLVDLERNDLGRVSQMGSVEVEELMTCETYQNVFHIVSQVVGQLRDGLDSVDILKALFPGGTITGAPKIRSMEIIDEFENYDRLYYTGSMGWFNGRGDSVLNILIRSLNITNAVPFRGNGRLYVGAGIVADSHPEKEFEETLAKASAWMTFLGQLK